jgi:hypothetical protein
MVWAQIFIFVEVVTCIFLHDTRANTYNTNKKSRKMVPLSHVVFSRVKALTKEEWKHSRKRSGSTRQYLYRVPRHLCQVFWPLGKAAVPGTCFFFFEGKFQVRVSRSSSYMPFKAPYQGKATRRRAPSQFSGLQPITIK